MMNITTKSAAGVYGRFPAFTAVTNTQSRKSGSRGPNIGLSTKPAATPAPRSADSHVKLFGQRAIGTRSAKSANASITSKMW